MPGRSKRKKAEKRRTVEKNKLGMKSLKKWSRALRRRQARTKNSCAKCHAKLGLLAN